jgi:hypothetical protein
MAEGQSQAQGLTFFDAHVRVAFVHGNTLADHGLEVLHLELELKLYEKIFWLH